ncbi:hypothetical protein D3C81_09460 [compost metagenome]
MGIEKNRGIGLILDPQVGSNAELTNLSKSKVEFDITFLMELLNCKTTNKLDIIEREGVLIARGIYSNPKPRWNKLVRLERFEVTPNGLDNLIVDLLEMTNKNKWEKVQDLPYLHINTGDFIIRLLQKTIGEKGAYYCINRVIRVQKVK